MFNAYVRNVTTFVSISFATSVMAMAPALADQTMKFKLVTHSTATLLWTQATPLKDT